MKKLSTKEVIEKIKKICDYDTSLVNYENANKKICLICHHKDCNGVEHGEFYVTTGHLKNGHGCPKCGIESRGKKRRTEKEEFIKKAKEIHGDKYDYSKIEYINSHTKICIICPKHGEFLQTPASHLNGRGCPKCNKPCYKYTVEDFIKKAKQVHGNKYDYSKIKYYDSTTKIRIICPKHGEFLQTPSEHLRKCGCKYCKESHLEGEIRKLLSDNNIEFKYDVRDINWLKPLTYDFYLPNYNIAIECQGEQHFKPIEYFGGMKSYEKLVEKDKLKKELSKLNGVKLLYYSSYKYAKNVITNLEEILKIIKNEKNRIPS